MPNGWCQQMVSAHFHQGVESSSILKTESSATWEWNGVSQRQAQPDRKLFNTIRSDFGKVTPWPASTTVIKSQIKVETVQRERKRRLITEGSARSAQQLLTERKPLPLQMVGKAEVVSEVNRPCHFTPTRTGPRWLSFCVIVNVISTPATSGRYSSGTLILQWRVQFQLPSGNSHLNVWLTTHTPYMKNWLWNSFPNLPLSSFPHLGQMASPFFSLFEKLCLIPVSLPCFSFFIYKQISLASPLNTSQFVYWLSRSLSP